MLKFMWMPLSDDIRMVVLLLQFVAMEREILLVRQQSLSKIRLNLKCWRRWLAAKDWL